MVDKDMLLQNIHKLYLEQDNRCYKCIYFSHHPVVGVGEPEREPFSICKFYNMSWKSSQSPVQVKRLIECMIQDAKQIK